MLYVVLQQFNTPDRFLLRNSIAKPYRMDFLAIIELYRAHSICR
jgi:hypothetical protein